jgi:TonB-linked SusC/RagA family outer membrane protein
MRKILLLIVLCLTIAWNHVSAQDRTVTGKVTASEDGAPLPGVNVVLKGSAIGTVTDTEGNFTLSVPSGSTLVFSFIGLTSQEVEVGTRNTIDVQMASDVTQLGEVVVTAAGIQREVRALGYGVARVGGDKVQQVSEPDPLRAMQGKIAGVNIVGSSGAAGSATRITIRGSSSLLGNTQPLFVVDGVPYDNSTNSSFNQLTGGGAYGSRFQDLDPNNIASINILKGAAAAALYGTRAANGVIVITTKTGSTKSSRKGLEVSFNSSFSLEEIGNLPEYQNTYGTGTNFSYSQVNGSWGDPFIGTRDYAHLESIPHWYDGVIGFENLWGTTVPYRAYPNNVKDFFRTGKLWDNSITLSTGNEKSNIALVVSRSTQDGYVPESKFNRTSISVGGNMNLDNGLIVGANLAYTNSFQHTFQGGANNAVGNSSAFARTLYLGRNWDLQGQPYQNPLNNSNAFFIATSQADNPYWSVYNAGLESNTDRYVASFSVGYDVKEWLNVTYRLGLNGYTQRQSDWFRPGSRGANGSGQITDFDVSFLEIESMLLASFDQDLSEKINLKATLGHNMNQRTTDSQAFLGTGYVIFDIDDIDNTNSVIPFGGTYSQRRIVGVLGDISLGYNNYLFLNVTGRNDWSSTLPQGNNSFFYPSVSTGFIFTDALNVESRLLNYGKVRASFSKVGNDTNPYQIVPTYNVNPASINQTGNAFPFQGVPGATLSNIARDPNLKPETTTEVELGLELKMFNNRANLDLAVYDRLSADQIASVAYPAASGYTGYFTNIGEVSNRGIEIGLGITPVQMQNGLSWDIYGTFTHNKNRVEDLKGIDELVLRNTFAGSVQSVHIKGQEYGLLKGTVSARDDEGNLLINPADGQLISDPTPAIIGNPNPDFILGVTNTIRYKGFTLSALVDYRQGGDLFSVTVNSLLGRGVTRDTENREMNAVIPGVYGDVNTVEPLRTPEGNKIPNTTMISTNTVYFGNSFGINAQDEWSVFDATVVRLREVSLSYEFPKGLISKTPFGSARISLTGRNLWYHAPNFPKYTNFDPETSQFGNTNAQGYEFAAAPSVKRYGVNLSLTF